MAITEFSSALNQVAAERGISVESVLESIRSAMLSAYKKDFLEQNPDFTGDIEETLADVAVDLNPDTGEARILQGKKDVTPAGFGRIAAQTAKQVMLQKIRETEKDVIMKEFREKIGTIVSGHIFRTEGSLVIFDLGKAHGIMPPSEKVEAETYRLNQRMKVLVKEIKEGPKGTEIVVSRSDPMFVAKLFEEEVPEIASGVVTIEAIAREAGSRTKMAVSSRDEKIDPVGSCVGQKGVRVQSVISEIFGEKIDVIPFSGSIEKFIASALSPAKVTEVEVNEEERSAKVSVPEDQLSLAIGKEGQNVRLAYKLTKWKIDIKGAQGLFGNDTSNSSESEHTKKEATQSKPKAGLWDADIKISNDAKTAAKVKAEESTQEDTQEETEDSKDNQ